MVRGHELHISSKRSRVYLMLKYPLYKFRFLGFMIAFDNKTVSCLKIISIFVKNALRKEGGNLKILCPPPGSCPGGQKFRGGAKWYQGGGRCPPCPPPESGPELLYDMIQFLSSLPPFSKHFGQRYL